MRQSHAVSALGATRARKKFLRYFRGGFRDEIYIDWERGYKWKAHQQWREALGQGDFQALLSKKRFGEIAGHAVRSSRARIFFSPSKRWRCAMR